MSYGPTHLPPDVLADSRPRFNSYPTVIDAQHAPAPKQYSSYHYAPAAPANTPTKSHPSSSYPYRQASNPSHSQFPSAPQAPSSRAPPSRTASVPTAHSSTSLAPAPAPCSTNPLPVAPEAYSHCARACFPPLPVPAPLGQCLLCRQAGGAIRERPPAADPAVQRCCRCSQAALGGVDARAWIEKDRTYNAMARARASSPHFGTESALRAAAPIMSDTARAFQDLLSRPDRPAPSHRSSLHAAPQPFIPAPPPPPLASMAAQVVDPTTLTAMLESKLSRAATVRPPSRPVDIGHSSTPPGEVG
ncbi:hypothetical protein FRC08_000805 [Ceratobasidium sp. 394]|nr:hypothetical protein FRC08_000805 [Ceratobasidium sp. 394]